MMNYGQRAWGNLAQVEQLSTFFGFKLAFVILDLQSKSPYRFNGKNTNVEDVLNAKELASTHLERQRKDEVFTAFYADVVNQ